MNFTDMKWRIGGLDHTATQNEMHDSLELKPSNMIGQDTHGIDANYVTTLVTLALLVDNKYPGVEYCAPSMHMSAKS